MATLFASDYYAHIKDMPLNSLAQALRKSKPGHPANKSDHFALQNWVRRFTILGSVIGRNKAEEAMPTFDNEFIEVTLKIPPELRFNNYIHRKFFKELAPELAAIPYQRTMLRADAPLMVWRLGETYQSYKEGIKREIWRLTKGKVYLPNKRSYLNFDEWLRLNENWKGFVKGLLLDEKAYYCDYLNKEYVKTLIQEHEAGKANHSQGLCYIVTFELFLRMFVQS